MAEPGPASFAALRNAMLRGHELVAVLAAGSRLAW